VSFRLFEKLHVSGWILRFHRLEQISLDCIDFRDHTSRLALPYLSVEMVEIVSLSVCSWWALTRALRHGRDSSQRARWQAE